MKFLWDELSILTSRQNARVKELFALQKERQAKKFKLIQVEGYRNFLTSAEQLDPEAIFLIDNHEGEKLWEQLQADHYKFKAEITPSNVYRLAPQLFHELSDTVTSPGLLGVFKAPELMDIEDLLKNISLSHNKHFVVLEQVADPGNLGTIIRTLEGLDFAGLILLGPSVWPFNSKSLRASMGSALSLPIYQLNSVYELETLKEAQPTLDIIAADMGGKNLIEFQVSPDKEGFVLVLGNEAHGLSSDLKKIVDYCVSIPIRGIAESYNLAISCGIISWYLSEAFLGE